MQIRCPDNGGLIPPENINVKENVALSPYTGEIHRLSDLIDAQSTTERDIDIFENPPGGVWLERQANRLTVGAKSRNAGTGCFLTFFAIFWNSIVSVFLVGPFLLPNQNNNVGRFGEDLFFTLFLTPFLLVGIGTAYGALLCLFGKEQVVIDGDVGRTSIGVGPLAWRRRFDATAVRSVTIGESSIQSDNQPMKRILIEADRDVTIGWSLSEPRREFVAAVLRTELLKRSRDAGET